MSLFEFKKICRDIRVGGRLRVLRFYLMGEPLLNPHLSEMIDVATKMKLAERTELTTNGILLNKEKSLSIINSGLDYLRISISSVYQRRLEDVTRTNTKVVQIYKNIKEFKRIRDLTGSSKPFLYIKMLDSLNNRENSRFLDMYQTLADEAVIEKPMNWDGYNNYDLLQVTYKGKQVQNTDELYVYPKSICPFPFYTLVINVNGDVTVCCVDWNKGTKIGNVFKSTLKSIWNGDKMRDLQCMHILGKRSLNHSCKNCSFLFTSPDNLDSMSKTKIKAIIGANKI
jgi:radical SAM protein with 4Fe4S-binding SPASM domain